MIYDLNENNFYILTAKTYDRPNFLQSEYEEDIKRIKYIKRLIQRYKRIGKIKERLILNHIIILSNVFGVEQTVKMLFLRIKKTDWDTLKTFLIYLKFMPLIINSVNGCVIKSSDIFVDLYVADILRNV